MSAVTVFLWIYILLGMLVGGATFGFIGLYRKLGLKMPLEIEIIIDRYGVPLLFALIILRWPHAVATVIKNRRGRS